VAVLAAAVLQLACASPTYEYVPTPVGFMLKHCVHTVPSGSVLEKQGNGAVLVRDSLTTVVRVIPPCDTANGTIPMIRASLPSTSRTRISDPLPPDYDGWLEYTAYNYAAGFDSFIGNFNVPDIPSELPDILYLFTGLQNIDWIPVADPEPTDAFDIIQPVLQYPGDFGNYWSVKSWYVTLDAGAIASSELELNVGDSIFGNMTRIAAQSWFVGSTSVASGKTTQISVTYPRLAVQPWAYCTVECYGCSGCSTYPKNPLVFSSMSLTAQGKSIAPAWKIDPKPSKLKQCQEAASIESPSHVTLYFDGHSGGEVAADVQ